MKFEPTMHKLSNGVTVLLDPMDLETVNVKVQFATGARDEAPNEYGITHFIEHMLCKGTARFPTKSEIDNYIELNSITKNAGTGIGIVHFYGRTISDNINSLIDVLGDQIQNSLFLPEKIEIERDVIADELRRSLDDEKSQLDHFITKTIFNNATYSSPKTLGTFENISSFTREQMLEFMARRLSANNCVIGISGKINDADAVLKTLEKSFNFLKNFDVQKNDSIIYTPSFSHNSKPDKNNVKLRIYFPDLFIPSLENRFNNMCINKFENFMTQKLRNIIRHENGLVYGFSGSGVGNEKLGATGFATEISPKNIEKCVALVAQNAYKIYNENEISDNDIIKQNMIKKIGNADWLESSGKRNDNLISFYQKYGQVFDAYAAIKISESINRDDVIDKSRGFFDGKMSILTQGANYKADLESIWKENFKKSK